MNVPSDDATNTPMQVQQMATAVTMRIRLMLAVREVAIAQAIVHTAVIRQSRTRGSLIVLPQKIGDQKIRGESSNVIFVAVAVVTALGWLPFRKRGTSSRP